MSWLLFLDERGHDHKNMPVADRAFVRRLEAYFTNAATGSLFSYPKTYGCTGANPAHSDFVAAPKVARDGKTVGLSPHGCRHLLDALKTLDMTNKDAARRVIRVGVRGRAMFAVLAYSGCRVGELVKLRVRDYRTTGEHRVLKNTGKENKERTTPLHPEAVERLAAGSTSPTSATIPLPTASVPRNQYAAAAETASGSNR